MIRRGTRVIRRTKKVGQIAQVGTIVEIHDYSVEIEWDDGHRSTISKEAVTPLTDANRPHKER